MTRRLGILAAALALLLLAAGCGGGGGERLSKADYEAKIIAVGKDVGERLGPALEGTEKNSKESLEKGTEAIRELADELEKVNPPEEIADAHEDLVGGLRQLADDLIELVDKLEKTKDPTEAFGLLLGMKSFQTLLRVQQEFKKKGYKLDLGES